MAKTNQDNNTLNVVSLTMHTDRTITHDIVPINDSTKAIKFFQQRLANKDQEVFAIVCLNNKAKPTHYSEVHVGSINASLVHPREVFKRAILSNATSIIIGHNHPSGDTTPSQSDLRITSSLVNSGDLLDIEVLDHIIVSETGGVSLRERYGEYFE